MAQSFQNIPAAKKSEFWEVFEGVTSDKHPLPLSASAGALVVQYLKLEAEYL